MIASEARILANRANALKSSGPRTPEGKERSRGNAIKHGLTGAGVALSTEDAEAVEARLAGYLADFRPVTEAGKGLARRAAMLSVRLDRSAIREAAAISEHVRAAEADFDEAREATVDALFDELDANPAAAVRRLVRTPEGIGRMLGVWADLRDDLTHGSGERWSDEHGFLAVHLTGRMAGGIGIARVEALTLAVVGDFSLLAPADGDGLGPEGRRAWARSALASRIGEEVEKLDRRLAEIDRSAIAADRAGAQARALFDPSKEATLARKYEAAAAREYHRALRDLKAVEAHVATERGPVAPPAPAPIPPTAGMGSFSPGPDQRPAEPSPTPPSASRFAEFDGSTLVSVSTDHDEPARS